MEEELHGIVSAEVHEGVQAGGRNLAYCRRRRFRTGQSRFRPERLERKIGQALEIDFLNWCLQHIEE
jgi:hypothetical protein